MILLRCELMKLDDLIAVKRDCRGAAVSPLFAECRVISIAYLSTSRISLPSSDLNYTSSTMTAK